jgi:hypothetical protein
MLSRDLVPIPNNARGWLQSASRYQLRSEKTEPLQFADVDNSANDVGFQAVADHRRRVSSGMRH